MNRKQSERERERERGEREGIGLGRHYRLTHCHIGGDRYFVIYQYDIRYLIVHSHFD